MANGNNKSPPANSQKAMNQLNAQNNNNKKSNNKIRKKINQIARSPDIRTSFYNALTNPFDPSSMGCQVPDPFPFPTQTFHVHQTTVLGNSNFTNGAVAFLPNPTLSMIDIFRATNIAGGTANRCVSSTPFTPYSALALTYGACVYGAVSPTSMSTIFSDYRVVSWGIKVSNLQPELSATGRLMVAMIPLGDTIPSYNELVLADVDTASTPIFGIENRYLASSNILELPTGFEVTVGDLLHGDLEIAGMYTNSSFWQFKTTINTSVVKSGTLGGDSLEVNNVGAVFSQGYKDNVRCAGGAAIVLYWEGIPLTSPNAFQVETIYHLEGTPNFSSTANNALVASTAHKATVGNTNIVETVMAKASKVENAVQWIEKGAQFLNNNKGTLMKIGSAAMAFL